MFISNEEKQTLFKLVHQLEKDRSSQDLAIKRFENMINEQKWEIANLNRCLLALFEYLEVEFKDEYFKAGVVPLNKK